MAQISAEAREQCRAEPALAGWLRDASLIRHAGSWVLGLPEHDSGA